MVTANKILKEIEKNPRRIKKKGNLKKYLKAAKGKILKNIKKEFNFNDKLKATVLSTIAIIDLVSTQAMKTFYRFHRL